MEEWETTLRLVERMRMRMREKEGKSRCGMCSRLLGRDDVGVGEVEVEVVGMVEVNEARVVGSED